MDQVYLWFLGVLILAVLIYSVRPLWLYKIRMLKGPFMFPFIGNYPQLYLGPEKLLAKIPDYGPLSYVMFGGYGAIVINDADMARIAINKYWNRYQQSIAGGQSEETAIYDQQHIFWSKDNAWKQLHGYYRQFVQPANLNKFRPLFARSSSYLIDFVDEHAKSGASFEAWHMFEMAVMSVVLPAFFAFDVNMFTQSHEKVPQKFLAIADIIWQAFNATKLGRWAIPYSIIPEASDAILKLAGMFPDKKVRLYEQIKHLSQDILEAQGDPKARLVPHAQYTSSSAIGVQQQKPVEYLGTDPYLAQLAQNPHTPFIEVLRNMELDGKRASLDEVSSNLSLSFLVGYDTTAATLAYLLSFLAQSEYKHVQERVIAEVDAYGAGKDVAKADPEEFPYILACMKETIRLYPVTPMILREVNKPMQMGPLQLQKDDKLMINAMAMHRDPKYWDEPKKFIPERHIPGSGYPPPKNPHAFLPFGGGARMCTGYKLAQMEGVIMIAKLYQQYKFSMDESQLPLQSCIEFIFHPVGGIHIKAEQRKVATA